MSATTRNVLAGVTAVLVVAAIVLTVLVVNRAADTTEFGTEDHDRLALESDFYGHDHTVLLPNDMKVSIRVGAPVDAMDYRALDDLSAWSSGDHPILTAPNGGSLVPVSWNIYMPGGMLKDPDNNTVHISLVAGDETAEIGSVRSKGAANATDYTDLSERHPAVYAFAEHVTLDDLAVQVAYAGVTQSLDVASGKIDAGPAQPLYESGNVYDTPCPDVGPDQTPCRLEAADPKSTFRPSLADFIASPLYTHPYDLHGGWARPGMTWATIGNIQFFGVDGALDAAGHYRRVRATSAPVFHLDGRGPVVTTKGVRKLGDIAEGYGTITFEIPADTAPHRLTVQMTYTLAGDQRPVRLPVLATVVLRPAH